MNTMNKVLAGHKYVANFLDAPVRIGMIYRMDDKQFIPAMHISDDFPDVNVAKLVEAGSKGAVKFNEAQEVSITFGASATTNIGESEVKVTFKKKRSVAGVIADAVIETLPFQRVMAELKQIWTNRGFVNFLKHYVFVYDVVSAASGTLIYSEDSNNQVVLKHKLGEKVTKLADLGSGNFEYISNTKRTLEIIRPIAHKPLFKAFRFRSNWEPEHLG